MQKVEQAEFVQADVAVKDHKVSVQGLLLDQTKRCGRCGVSGAGWNCDGISAGNAKVIVSHK